MAGSLLLPGAVAGAQDDDPYGSTSTTRGPQDEPALKCHLELTSGEAGAEATVTVTNVPSGVTVRILVGGVEAGRATAPAASQDGFTTLQIPIVIPDLPPGRYAVTAVGVDFTLQCTVGDSDGFDVVEVLSGEPGGDDGDGIEVLAFTGANILILVALALLLLLAGHRLLKQSRRRRRRLRTH